MFRMLCAALLFSVAGCSFLEATPEPVQYVVKRGDTLGQIAKVHGVTVDDLRSWNGIEGDLIEVDQVLEIHIPGEPPAERIAKQVNRSVKKSQGSLTPQAGTGFDTSDLRKPSPKKCLSGPLLAGGDEEMAASAGLEFSQVKGALDGFLPQVNRCFSGMSAAPSNALQLEITVSCNGTVDQVRIAEQADWPAEAAQCVSEVLAYTPFPAHDLPDGETFTYPIRLQ